MVQSVRLNAIVVHHENAGRAKRKVDRGSRSGQSKGLVISIKNSYGSIGRHKHRFLRKHYIPTLPQQNFSSMGRVSADSVYEYSFLLLPPRCLVFVPTGVIKGPEFSSDLDRFDNWPTGVICRHCLALRDDFLVDFVNFGKPRWMSEMKN